MLRTRESRRVGDGWGDTMSFFGAVGRLPFQHDDGNAKTRRLPPLMIALPGAIRRRRAAADGASLS